VPKIGIVGNLIPIKGHEDFLRMAALLKDRGTEAEYWIIGEDIHRTGHGERLKQMSRRLGLNDQVVFWGFRTDIAELLNQLSVLVVASHVEPFGIVAVEGMACELPVVATRVGGIPEVIQDGVTGFLVPSRSPDDLAERVALLLFNPELRRRMGKMGRARAESMFSDETHARRISDLYSRIIAG
jgi:glycosyltransferase involved in cell wall biosynthesis